MKFERIRELREDADLTQTELAKILHVSQCTYSHWEIGFREPSISMLIKIADYHDVSIDYLLNRSDVKIYEKSKRKKDNS